MDLADIVQQSSDPHVLLERLQSYFLSLPPSEFGTLDDTLAILTPHNASADKATVLKLFTIEALLYLGEKINPQKIDDLFKLLAGLSVKRIEGSQSNLTRLKYLDLLSDYQFLLSDDVRDLKLIELVSKKLNFLVSEDESEPLVRDIQAKVLVFYLLCGSDFRKKNVYKYLNDEDVFSRGFPLAIQNFVSLSLSGALVPIDAYSQFVDHLNSLSVEFRSIYKKHSENFLENFLETNLEKLPKYYKTIKVSRIQSLLLKGNKLVDIEELICRMINSKKLPSGTKIDQLDDIVDFGDDLSKYDSFNAHIKKVCNLVESLASQP